LSQIAQLLVSNVKSLSQLEIDLASPEMSRADSRPVGEPTGNALTRWEAEVQEKPGQGSSYKELTKKLLGTTTRRNKKTGIKELEGVPWPLGARSMHHWSSRTLKNAKRDVPRHALLGLIEKLVVSEYRAKLFHKSAAACFLRTRLQQILEDGLKEPEGSTDLQGQGRAKWTYPDGIKWEPKSFASHAEASKLLLDDSRIAETKERGQEISGLLNRILRHKAALMKPGDPEYSGMVAPEVSESVYNLLNVSCESYLARTGLIHKCRL